MTTGRLAWLAIAVFTGMAIPTPYVQPATDSRGRWLARVLPAVTAYKLLLRLETGIDAYLTNLRMPAKPEE